MTQPVDTRCTAPGCTNERTGLKFCAKCAAASKQESILKGRVKYLAKLKAQRAAKKAAEVKSGKVTTKPCPVCKTAQIPLKRHYCDTCRDATIKQRKRDSQKRLRQKEKTGPVHYGFGKLEVKGAPVIISDEQQEALNKRADAAQRARENKTYAAMGLVVSVGRPLASEPVYLCAEEKKRLETIYQPPSKAAGMWLSPWQVSGT